MVLDIGNDRYPDVWRRSRALRRGKPWVFGYVHRITAPAIRSTATWTATAATSPPLVADPQAGRLAGFGMFPEGLHNNSIVYEEAYDLAWGAGEPSLAAWLSAYAKSRYGRTTPELEAARWARWAKASPTRPLLDAALVERPGWRVPLLQAPDGDDRRVPRLSQ